jgi:hypothetical protein
MKGLFLPVKWSCALLLAFSMVGAPAQIAPELQEQGVLYFDGNLPNKVTAALHTRWRSPLFIRVRKSS